MQDAQLITSEDTFLWRALTKEQRTALRVTLRGMVHGKVADIRQPVVHGFLECAFCRQIRKCYVKRGRPRCADCRRQMQKDGDA